jgi:hypothetical protein
MKTESFVPNLKLNAEQPRDNEARLTRLAVVFF